MTKRHLGFMTPKLHPHIQSPIVNLKKNTFPNLKMNIYDY